MKMLLVLLVLAGAFAAAAAPAAGEAIRFCTPGEGLIVGENGVCCEAYRPPPGAIERPFTGCRHK